MKTSTKLLEMLPLVATVLLVPAVVRAEDDSTKNHGFLPESEARRNVIDPVMPEYPDEAVRLHVFGIVHVMIEVSCEGEVLMIKGKQRTPSLLKKVVANAVKQWRFKPHRHPYAEPLAYFSRLIFEFIIDEKGPRVQMYTPYPDPRYAECLGCTNTLLERRYWREWETLFDRSDQHANLLTLP
jgi:hypothetical protein